MNPLVPRDRFQQESGTLGLEAALRKQQIAAHSLLQYDGGIDPTKTVIAADRVLPKDAKVLHFLKEFGHGVRFL